MLRDAWGQKVLAAPRSLATTPRLECVLYLLYNQCRRASIASGGWELREDAAASYSHPRSCLQLCPAATEGLSGGLPVPAEPAAAELGWEQAAMGDAVLASSTPIPSVPPAQCTSQLSPAPQV